VAVLLTWALFLGWAAVGLAVLKLGRFRWSVPTLLLAPTVGFSTLVIPVYILVRFGVPVRTAAVPVALGAVALVALWRLWPTAARARGLWKQSRAFVGVLVGTFVLTGWPLFGYGFDWVAIGNDDMANYCVMAAGYRDHGYAAVPTLDDLVNCSDESQSYWFVFVLKQIRPGSEVLLALTAAWTGLAPQQVFMPTILALNMALVASGAALAATGTRRRRVGLLTGALLAVSAPTTYGVIHQLIAQASGLALLCTSFALVAGRFRRLPGGLLFRRAGVCGLAFAGQTLFYPEVIPILVGGCVLLGVRDLVGRRLDRRHLVHAAAAIAVMVALLPVYLFGAVTFLALQRNAGATSADEIVEIFPYYLTPRGPALLWGLLPISGAESAALQNACIVAGLLLLVAVAGPAVIQMFRRQAFAAALVVVAVMTAALYANRGAFGLFKIAMFAQPFLWAVVAAWAAGRRARWGAAAAAVLLLAVAGLNARVQFRYVNESRGRECQVSLPAVSARHGFHDFRAAYASRIAGGGVDRVLLATENNTLMKLLAAEVRGAPVGTVGMAPFELIALSGLSTLEGAPWVRFHADRTESLRSIRTDFAAAHEQNRLTVRDPDTGHPLHRLTATSADRSKSPERVLVAAGGGGVTVFNRQRFPETGPVLVCTPLTELSNFAVFCDASGARQLFLGMGEPDDVALHQLESDPLQPKRTMAGVGRSVVLDVLNPSPRVRVLVDYTAAYKGDPSARDVAPMRIVGDRRAAFGAVGAGAARLVSPPVSTQAVGSSRFLVVEFAVPRSMNPNRLSLAERWWGADLPRDRRRLTGHVRDVSVLSEEEYAAFRPPERVTAFPAGLADPHLEYSGFYEEGWVSKEFKVRLTQPTAGQEVVFRGQVPALPGSEAFQSEMVVLIDGAPVEKRALGTGNFEVRVPGGAAAGPRWIECRFSHTLALPGGDGRTVVAQMRSIGFEPADASKARPPEQLSAFPADLSHPKLVATGIDSDGWVGKTGKAQLWYAGAGRDLVVRGSVPRIAGAFRTELTVLLDGKEVGKRGLTPGDFEVRVPGDTGPAGPRWVECRFSDVQPLPAPDTRVTAAHLAVIGFEPTK